MSCRTITKQRSVDGRWERACFSYRTLGDELDDAHLGWRFYTSRYYAPSSDGGAIWSGYQAVAHIYHGPDWHKVVTPQKQFLADVAHGRLAAFTWITPTCANSDHPSCGGGTGPSWVTSLVNAVGTSKFWSSSAVFIVWDDWGGLYDHVAPPYADDDSLGMRVPLLIVSPYAKSGYVSHVQYETASVLRFAEDLFGLAALGAADRRAASPAADCFDFSRGPRKFVSIRAPQGREFSSTSRRTNVRRTIANALPPRDEHDAVALVLVEKRKPFHHPGIEAAAGVARDLAHDVYAVAQPCQLVTGGRRKDCALAILTLVAVLRYVFAIVSVRSCKVV